MITKLLFTALSLLILTVGAGLGVDDSQSKSVQMGPYQVNFTLPYDMGETPSISSDYDHGVLIHGSDTYGVGTSYSMGIWYGVIPNQVNGEDAEKQIGIGIDDYTNPSIHEQKTDCLRDDKWIKIMMEGPWLKKWDGKISNITIDEGPNQKIGRVAFCDGRKLYPNPYRSHWVMYYCTSRINKDGKTVIENVDVMSDFPPSVMEQFVQSLDIHPIDESTTIYPAH